MIVVCDSSILIPLACINQLHLLEDIYGGVFIPMRIYDEIVSRGRGRAGANAVRDAAFIHVESVQNPHHVQLYTDTVSRGDAEVIVLAKERGADLILSRDRGLRRRARRERLAVFSLVELLIFAKHNDFIEAVKPFLDELQEKGVLIREGVYREALRQAGETA